jgi:uncharacterized protein (DUF488 family)
MATLYTIGHSTRHLDELVAVLRAHGIATLADIRAFPMSRRLPHFNREALEKELPRFGIIYRWQPELGGRRKRLRDDSPNLALRNESFRNYADYMLTAEFAAALDRVVALPAVALMCAERVWLRGHRMLVSDALVARGHTVLHIDDERPGREHRLTEGCRIYNGGVIYDVGGEPELFNTAPRPRP